MCCFAPCRCSVSLQEPGPRLFAHFSLHLSAARNVRRTLSSPRHKRLKTLAPLSSLFCASHPFGLSGSLCFSSHCCCWTGESLFSRYFDACCWKVVVVWNVAVVSPRVRMTGAIFTREPSHWHCWSTSHWHTALGNQRVQFRARKSGLH